MKINTFANPNFAIAPNHIPLIAVGVGLLILLVNCVISYASKHFETIQNPSKQPVNHALKTSHTGAGVLPYCIQNGEVYFLLSKEGFGSAANTWCDFGGAKDPGETAVQTAARECWEESRGILGEEKTIEKALYTSTSLGQKYIMFLMEVDTPWSKNNQLFASKVYTDYCRMEKTEIAWVKASDVFNAARDNQQIWINHSNERLRGFFAEILKEEEKAPKLQKLFQGATYKLSLQPQSDSHRDLGNRQSGFSPLLPCAPQALPQ